MKNGILHENQLRVAVRAPGPFRLRPIIKKSFCQIPKVPRVGDWLGGWIMVCENMIIRICSELEPIKF